MFFLYLSRRFKEYIIILYIKLFKNLLLME